MTDIKHRLERQGQKVRLLLEGEIDMYVAPGLRNLLHQLISEKPQEIVVDLKNVPFIDSSGVATLVEAVRRLKGTNSILRVENPTQPVRYTFEITQLAKIFGIEKTAEKTASDKASEKTS
ncbi:MAG: STAS domain-containing protein [Planctomycetes bacterium]|nr:STAS domain-containing protein [Planctomycetota bacterium]